MNPDPATPQHASGSFSVTMTPHDDAASEPAVDGAATLGRMRLDKRYEGPLEAEGRGQMLSAISAVKGSAGYVAVERVAGRLHGRAGSFVLQHSGLMDRGAPQLVIVVVPDSGTGALRGLAGRMQIRIEQGRHFYDFDYTLPD